MKKISLTFLIFLIISFSLISFFHIDTSSAFGAEPFSGYNQDNQPEYYKNVEGSLPVIKKIILIDKNMAQDLSLAALAYTTDFSSQVKIQHIALKANTKISEMITLTLNYAQGGSIELASEILNNEADFLYIPEGELYLASGDQLKIECSNNNLTGTVKVTVRGEKTI